MTTPPTSLPEPGPDIRLTLTLTSEEAQQGGVKSVGVDGNLEEVRFPAGVTDGRELRLPGRGGPSLSGGPSGALIVTLQVPPAPERGGDIRRTLRVTWDEAQLGGMKVLTVDGRPQEIPYPAGARDGLELRRAGTGSPGRGGGPAGDLVVTLQVMPEPVQGAVPPPPSRTNSIQEVPGPGAVTPPLPQGSATAGFTPPPSFSPPPPFPPQSFPPASFPPTSSSGASFPTPPPPTFPTSPSAAYPPQGPQRGEDVRVFLPLTVAQAMAGGMQGVMVNGQWLEVPVPYGVTDGHEMRRPGGGMPGVNGAPPGDLVVVVRVTAAPTFSPARSPARWLVPVSVVAGLIILGLIVFGLMHSSKSQTTTTAPVAAALDYSQMQFWRTLPPPGGAANTTNPDSAFAMAFASNDNLVVGYFPNNAMNTPQLLLWNVPNIASSTPGALAGTSWLNAHDVAVAPGGMDFAVGGFDTRTSKNVLAEYSIGGSLVKYWTVGPGGAAGVTDVAYSPNGKFVAVSCGDIRNRPGVKSFKTGSKPTVKGNVTLWDASGTTDGDIASGDGGDAWCADFTPDNAAVAYGETQYIYQYPLRADGTVSTDHPNVLSDKQDGTVAFISVLHSTDGQSLYVIVRTNRGSDAIQKLNAKTGTVVMVFQDKTGTLAYALAQKIALSPDGRCLAVGGVDNQNHTSVSFWDTGTGTPLGQPQLAHDGQIYVTRVQSPPTAAIRRSIVPTTCRSFSAIASGPVSPCRTVRSL